MTLRKIKLKMCLLAVLVLLANCSDKVSLNNEAKTLKSVVYFDLNEEHLIELPIDFNVGLNLTVQPFTRNDTDFIMMGDIEGSRLVEIDITNKRFSRALSLPRVAAGTYPVFVNHYLNEDTIIILRGISNEHGLNADTVK